METVEMTAKQTNVLCWLLTNLFISSKGFDVQVM